MQITGHFTINAPATKVWDILATNFQHVGKWASSISHSVSSAPSAAGEQGRICHTKFGKVEETITHVDADKGLFSYRTEKPPFFIRSATNLLQIEAEGAGRTHLKVQAEVNLIPFLGWIVRPIIEKRLQMMVDHFVEGLNYYAETGNIHPRKLNVRTNHAPRNEAEYSS